MNTDDQHLEDSEGAEAAEGAEDDPRPVFEGDWASASGAEKGRHGQLVRQWKERHGLLKRAAPASADAAGVDAEVAAILGSVEPSARLDSRAARVLRDISEAADQPGSARVSAARALVEEEREAQRLADSETRRAATAALLTLPTPQRLRLLERIVRRDEAPGWRSVLDGQEGADPADSAGAAE